jgi:23S rRNA (uracil1939-C5)-methyltransferase
MSLLTLDIEKATAGGRMLARHKGQIVLVSGAIPGEHVTARLERTAKGVAFAEVVDVLSSSADRRPATADWRCGGNVFLHIGYPRQLQLKGEIVQDAFGRIGHVALPVTPTVIGSPEHGYRMRARLHVQDGQIGLYREGTHQLCAAATTGQFTKSTTDWIAAAQQTLIRKRLTGASALVLAENVPSSERACHLELSSRVDPAPFAALSDGLVGLSAQRADRPAVVWLAGTPAVTDTIRVGESSPALQLRRDVRAFFQGNRFLLEQLVQHVTDCVPGGPVIDLYAGVGLFGLSLAATGREAVTVVEGDPVSGADLERNAQPFGGRVTVVRSSVEAFLSAAARRDTARTTLIVDPPRTGLSREAIGGLTEMGSPRIVYVSCDVATLARDSRTLMDAGYGLEHVSGIDLFPNTAHVETIAVFTR